MNSQQNAIRYETKLKAKMYELQQKLATKSAFLKYYSSILSKSKSQRAAFDITSLLYFKLFGEDLFRTWDAFRMYKNKDLKK